MNTHLQPQIQCRSASLRLMDLFIEYGYEHSVAAKNYAYCERMQRWMFEFLFDEGLRPHHDFLDIGCGWLRLPYVILPYLEDGRYHGIDSDQINLDIGLRWLKEAGVQPEPMLLIDRDFAFDRFGKKFDIAFSHAVFTHLSHAQVEQCLRSLQKVMKPGGICYFTFYRSSKDWDGTSNYSITGKESLSYEVAHLTLRYFRQLFRDMDVDWEYLGTKGHPTGHAVIKVIFTRPPSALRRIFRSIRSRLA
jgi:2-polyprenyl-3-methyl-5-hydroxy-6-metoxy-1,4-benzoquinol methylase